MINIKLSDMVKPGKIFIGTSGWSYKHWNNNFYPQAVKAKDQLAYYSSIFNTVELNSSFYALPLKKTFDHWRDTVPEDFTFSVKASRYITHLKKLIISDDAVSIFLDHAMHLKEKMGPVLFQLPPKWKCDTVRLKNFLDYLPEGNKYVFEFRNADWYKDEVYQLLADHNCSFCIYELAGHQAPAIVTANHVYIRLHGPEAQKYQGSYTKAQLKNWAKQCKHWQEAGKDVYLYFDNDQLGYAAFNALDLKTMLGA
jgi:uncharacterized protein YecE (DUF72 family)